ncbi:MAG: hypothetical protein IH614_11595 [Desulfuromonadales bacterium]|nr:hypothetical protein [Desulfuromonadales bacterium]
MKANCTRRLWRLLAVVGALGLLSACMPVATGVVEPLQQQEDSTVTWQQEYRFAPPGGGWQLIDLDEDDYSIAYMKLCQDGYPCQSTFAYAEEPFGYSLDFEERQAEFFKRFLWAGRVIFEPARLRKVQLPGGEGLEAVTIGREPVLGHKVRAKIIFARRGERVVAFYYSQWRPEAAAFDLTEEADFDRFVASFRFLQPSFYERLAEPPR